MSITRSTHNSIAAIATAAALVPFALTGTAGAAVDPVAQERYYSSYGSPKPLSRPDTPATSDETPWLPLGLAVGGSVILVATTASQRQRARIRRRAARTPA